MSNYIVEERDRLSAEVVRLKRENADAFRRGAERCAKRWREEADAIKAELRRRAGAPSLLWHGEMQGRMKALHECAAGLLSEEGA